MKLTAEQEAVLAAIFRLSTGNPAVPITIGALHHSFTDMDVSMLVRHLSVLLELGLIENARPGGEQLGNTCRITAAGIAYCTGNANDKT